MYKLLFTAFFVLLALSAPAQNSSRKYNAAENEINWQEAFDPRTSDFYVHNEIEINATPEQVWELLIQAKNWIQWYDGIQNIRFEDTTQQVLAKDTKVFWNSMGQRLNNTVIAFTPYRALAWQFNEAKIQGQHAWVIIPTPNGCRVITDESQTGKLARLQKTFLPRKLLKQHDKWLRLLKQEAEKRNPGLGALLNAIDRGKEGSISQQAQPKPLGMAPKK